MKRVLPGTTVALTLLALAGSPAPGVSDPAETIVTTSLRWLARHQDPEGTWGGREAPPEHRIRITGMALTCFLSAGYTYLSRDRFDDIGFGDVVKKGLYHLLASQSESGCLSPDKSDVRTHVWAALPIVLAYHMTESAMLSKPAVKAIAWMEQAQRPSGGWGEGDLADPMLTAQATVLLSFAASGELPIPDGLKQGVDKALREIAERDALRTLAPVDAAAFMAADLAWRADRADAALDGRAERTRAALDGASTSDAPLLFWGSLALLLHGGPQGPSWKGWCSRLKNIMFEGVRLKPLDPDLNGSWEGSASDPPPPSAPPVDSPLPPDKAGAIRALIGALNDDLWTERESATRELVRIGHDAVPALKAALDRGDAETRVRAASILRGLLSPVADLRTAEATCFNLLSLINYYRYQLSPGTLLFRTEAVSMGK